VTEAMRALWNAAAERFDEEPDHGLTDPAVRRAWTDLLVEGFWATGAGLRAADLLPLVRSGRPPRRSGTCRRRPRCGAAW
jgi:hypothetical protein